MGRASAIEKLGDKIEARKIAAVRRWFKVRKIHSTMQMKLC